MAQFLFRHLAERSGWKVADDPQEYGDFYVDSAATSREEIGNPVDRRTVAKLKDHGIVCGKHRARQITKKDYEFFDYILLMDEENLWGLHRILPDDPDGKVHMILEYAQGTQYQNRRGGSRDVADPWYTHDFEQTYQDLLAGCTGLLQNVSKTI